MKTKDLKTFHLVLVIKYILLSWQKKIKESDLQLSIWIYPKYTQLLQKWSDSLRHFKIEEKSFTLLQKIVTKYIFVKFWDMLSFNDVLSLPTRNEWMATLRDDLGLIAIKNWLICHKWILKVKHKVGGSIKRILLWKGYTPNENV